MTLDLENRASTVACGWVFVIATIALFASSGAAAKDRDSKKTKKAGSRDEIWVLPPGDYHQLLETVDPQDEVSGELRVRVRSVPNALHYFMSRECEELDRAGYDDKTLGKKLVAAYKKYKYHKDKALFIVTVSGSSGKSRPFYISKPTRHFDVKTKGRKAAMHIVEEKRKPRSKIWEVYQYVPNATRKVGKKKLALADRHTFSFSSRHVSADHKDPIVLTVSGMLGVRSVKGGAGDEGLGVNERYNQISMFRWRDQIMAPLRIRIFPGRWRVPEPPRELVELIDRLGR